MIILHVEVYANMCLIAILLEASTHAIVDIKIYLPQTREEPRYTLRFYQRCTDDAKNTGGTLSFKFCLWESTYFQSYRFFCIPSALRIPSIYRVEVTLKMSFFWWWRAPGGLRVTRRKENASFHLSVSEHGLKLGKKEPVDVEVCQHFPPFPCVWVKKIWLRLERKTERERMAHEGSKWMYTGVFW